jgi:hypothetical protein
MKIATAEPVKSPGNALEYRVYAVGTDGHFIGCNEMICRDDDEAVAQAKRLVVDSDIELWNRDRFLIRLGRRPE